MNNTVRTAAAATLTVAATTLSPSALAESSGFPHVIRVTESDSIVEIALKRTVARDREVVAVAREAIVSLLDERDHLGYMIENARGNITDEELAELVAARVEPRVTDDEELGRKTLVLARLVGERIDAELVSAVFQCDFAQADRVLAAWRSSGRG